MFAGLGAGLLSVSGESQRPRLDFSLRMGHRHPCLGGAAWLCGVVFADLSPR
jgi:hypothetical protein